MNFRVFFPKTCNLTRPSPYNYAQKSAKKTCGICSKLTIKTSERHQCFLMFSWQCGRFDAFVNFEQISHLVLELILVFEQVNTRRVYSDLCIYFYLFC